MAPAIRGENMQKKQTLDRAMQLIRAGKLRVDLYGLDGCPVGGWPETQQAILRLSDEIPHRSERSYTVYDLIDRLYTVVGDRYRAHPGTINPRATPPGAAGNPGRTLQI